MPEFSMVFSAEGVNAGFGDGNDAIYDCLNTALMTFLEQ